MDHLSSKQESHHDPVSPTMTVEPAQPGVVNGKQYFLPSDSDERERLALQHSLVLNGTEGKHIHAPVDIESIGSVLETATGSGIWLEEVAKLVPTTTELIGVDISLNLFPPSPPSNIQFLERSVLHLPEEWSNKFDLVHQRLLLLGLRNEEWHTAFNEIYRVLRPGGWFQLYEIDGWEECGPVQEKFNQLLSLLVESRGAHGIWPGGSKRWQRTIEEVGFKDIRVTWHGWPTGSWAGEEGLRGKQNFLGFIRGCKVPMLKGGGFGIISGESEFDEWLVEAERELDTRDGTRMRCIMICGQKPL